MARTRKKYVAPAPETRRMIPVRVRARYDAASYDQGMEKHWANADFLSPDFAAVPSVRRTLRSRSRYEVANNSYAAGIVSTLANYVVGTGPTLRLVPKSGAGKRATVALADLSARFNSWAWDVQLAKKLNILQRAKTTDGEGCAMLVSRRVPAGKVSLGIRPFEADMLSRPDDMTGQSQGPEGIELDGAGDPARYWVLKSHPGGTLMWQGAGEAVPVAPGNMVHWFDELRPGLNRGLPEIMPALPMFAQLRRYTSAVITAAEAAADLAGVIHTDTPPGEQPAEVDAGTTFDLEKGTLVSLPEGYKMSQMKAENPGPQHESFLKTIIREIGRCVDMPLAVAAMDSSGHNFSSMRGDWQAFFASIRYRRHLCEQQVLEKILIAWLAEARLVFGIQPPEEFDYVWDWPAAEPADPVKQAEASKILLEARLTTYAREYSKMGLNADDELRQRAREEDLLRDLGIAPAAAAPVRQAAQPDDGEDAE
jgi:capsid protein